MQVDYLEVVNRGYVRVYFKSDRGGVVSLNLETSTCKAFSATACSSPLTVQKTSTLKFNIGSVDSFERNLELAQKELGIDPTEFIAVSYVTETDLL